MRRAFFCLVIALTLGLARPASAAVWPFMIRFGVICENAGCRALTSAEASWEAAALGMPVAIWPFSSGSLMPFIFETSDGAWEYGGYEVDDPMNWTSFPSRPIDPESGGLPTFSCKRLTNVCQVGVLAYACQAGTGSNGYSWSFTAYYGW